MEGPSLLLAAEQLAPFIGKTVVEVGGNTKIGKDRLADLNVLDIFSWGKHLVFQFSDFALRVHFMLYGSFEATVLDKKVTGDYPKKAREPRLKLVFKNGEINFYSCSLRFIESSAAKSEYDYSTDIMNSLWNSPKALEKMAMDPKREIGDVLLDQTIFTGIGNIIKNEVLFLVKTAPTRKIEELTKKNMQEIIKTARSYVVKFYKWRKVFKLREHYQVYKRTVCPQCDGKILREVTGVSQRISYVCPTCQNLA